MDSAGAPEQAGASRLSVLLIAALIVFAYTATLGMSPLLEPDEARYAEIAREMLELNDWVTPHLNYVKYFEKPPLVYWLNAVTFEAFGLSDYAARLWPALLGLVGLVCAWSLARSIYGKLEGLLAAAILAATPFYFGLSQVLILDMPLSTFMAVALTAAWHLYQRPEHAQRWAALMYAAAALAVLTKGPVAVVLMGGILVSFVVMRWDFGFLRRLLSPRGIGLFLLIAAPWFVLVTYRNPEFFDFFIIDQHFNRYLRPSEHRQPLLFFVPFILGGMLPWTLLLATRPRLIMEQLQRLLRLRVAPGTLYCILWATVIFAFFSMSGSKLATYILPVFCPLAVLVSRAVADLWRANDTGVFRSAAGLFTLLAVAGGVASVVTPIVSDHHRAPLVVPYLIAGSLLLGAIAYALWRQLRGAAPSFARLLAITIVSMPLLGAVAMAGRSAGQHYTPLALTLRDQIKPGDTAVMYRHYTQGIPLYSQRRIVMVREWGELDFGSRQGDQSEFFWKDDGDLVRAWNSGRRMFLIINNNELPDILAQLDPAPREIARYGKKLLVVNFPAS